MSLHADDERVILAQRLFVAMVEARNIDGQKYGEFRYEPIRPEHAWAELRAVAAEAPNYSITLGAVGVESAEEKR